MISIKSDLQMLINHGIIEEVPSKAEKKWTDEDMIEFHEYCLINFVPITGLSSERLLEEFKEYKEQANEKAT